MIFALLLATTTPAWPFCSDEVRDRCVVDGDTIRQDYEKIRLLAIDAPELRSAKCSAELELAGRATRRLGILLGTGQVTAHRSGRDRDKYGRLLRIVRVDGRDVGAVLVREGLARKWEGRRLSWC